MHPTFGHLNLNLLNKFLIAKDAGFIILVLQPNGQSEELMQSLQ